MTGPSQIPPDGIPASVEEYRVNEALKAQERGWSLTPLKGKKPIHKGWTQAPPPDRDTTEQMARKGNVGLRTGNVSGIVVIDDDSDDGSAAADLNLPPTPTVITGSGKKHHYFESPKDGLGNSVRKLGPKVDVRADGGQVAYAGSVHPETEQPYHWAPGLSPEDVPLAKLPAHILSRLRGKKRHPKKKPMKVGTKVTRNLELIRCRAESVLKEACSDLRSAPEGERNDILNRLAFTLGGYIGADVLDRSLVELKLGQAALDSGLDDEEIGATLTSGLDAGEKEPFDITKLKEQKKTTQVVKRLTDLGNAERMAELFREDIRFCYPWKKFLTWDESHWNVDQAGRVMRMAKTTVRGIYAEAVLGGSVKEREAIASWGKISEKKDRIVAMIELVKSEDSIPVQPDDLDHDPWLLNFTNGTLDLRTRDFRPHSRTDLITKFIRMKFNPQAHCPNWNRFLEQILPVKKVRQFVQRAVGYSLTGSQAEQVFFLLHGEGANGKSTFLLTLLRALGRDYAIQAAPELLLKKNHGNHPTEIADLFGVRFAATVEVGEGRKLDEVLIKQLTGGDRVRARRMREDFWEFDPTHHIWLAVNHLPEITGTDKGIRRRIKLIPFRVQIPDRHQDRTLSQKLLEELPGIMAWAVEGCHEWRQQGLNPPEEVLLASASHCPKPSPNNVVRSFVNEATRAIQGGRVRASILFDRYREWCEENGGSPVSQTAFGRELSLLGLLKKKTGGLQIYVDISLTAHSSDEGTVGTVGTVSTIELPCTPRVELETETIPTTQTVPLSPRTGSSQELATDQSENQGTAGLFDSTPDLTRSADDEATWQGASP